MLTRRGFIATAAAAASARAVPIVVKAKPKWITEIVRGPNGVVKLVEKLVR